MAIAFDASSSGQGTSVSSKTVSHTCTGANLILVVGVYIYKGASGGNDNLTGVTYNGVAMTQAIKLQRDGVDGEVYIYTLVNPATGANNIVATAGVSQDAILVLGCSYTGTKQSGQPDATGSDRQSANSITASAITIADNCWLVGMVNKDVAGTLSAGSNTFIRNQFNTQNAMIDTNADQTPAGSHSMNTTSSTSGDFSMILISVAPVASTAIKTVDGLANASVKTVNDLARASVKTIDGLA